jgi:1-deoxy-D-xylulose-5-phosphate reductoisomerase
VSPLDLVAAARLDFESPDESRFPCLRLARESVAAGGTAMVVCNAANEVAVAAFLDQQIRFTEIPVVIEHTLVRMDNVEPISLSVIESADAQARQVAAGCLADMQRSAGREQRV